MVYGVSDPQAMPHFVFPTCTVRSFNATSVLVLNLLPSENQNCQKCDALSLGKKFRVFLRTAVPSSSASSS
jgi:hypothetical protein